MTQFEVATAAAFVAFAAARVEAAVIEAGLGGRLDATNTIPSRVTVLTSVGLDHTEWLGETEVEIAAEKLAVLRDHSTLVARPGRRPRSRALAERTAAERGAELIRAPEDPGDGGAPARPGGASSAATSRSRAAGRPRPSSGAARPGSRRRGGGDADDPRPPRAARRRARRSSSTSPTTPTAPRPRRGPPRGRRRPPGGRLPRRSSTTRTPRGSSPPSRPALDRAVCTEIPADGPKRPRPGRRLAPA